MFVGVTDKTWCKKLRERGATEANFWRPGSTGFQALEPGGLFLFKIHYPENCIVGGGYFLRYLRMPLSLAWTTYGELNGCDDVVEFRRRLERYNPKVKGVRDPEIGCILLGEVFWLEPNEWIPAPSTWARPIVQGQQYAPNTKEYQDLLAALNLFQSARAVLEQPAAYGEARQQRIRLGQSAFRALVTDNYGRRCAVTGERTLPVLDAAHIQPFSVCNEHRQTNGILLRADLHRLFDQGLITVTPAFRLEVSRKIHEEYQNGRVYYAMDGRELEVLPRDINLRPDPEMLRWHNESLFER